MLCWSPKALQIDVAEVLMFCWCCGFVLMLHWYLTSMKNKCCYYGLTKCWFCGFLLKLYWCLCWQKAYVLLMLMQHWHLFDETLMRDWFLRKSIYFLYIFCRGPPLAWSTEKWTSTHVSKVVLSWGAFIASIPLTLLLAVIILFASQFSSRFTACTVQSWEKVFVRGCEKFLPALA